MVGVMQQVLVAAGDGSGLVDANLDVDARKLIVYWHGDVPEQVQAVLDTSAEEPFEVVVTPARFSRAALTAEGRRLRSEHPGVVTGLAVRIEGDGLYVRIAPELVGTSSPHAVVAQLGITGNCPLWFDWPAPTSTCDGG
jgi:hypothetical protein